MWTRIGFAIARQQLRANGGAALSKCVALRGHAVAHSGVILRRAFTVSRRRAFPAAAAKTSTKKTAAKPKTTKSTAKPKAKKPAAKKAKKPAVKKTARKKKVLTEAQKRTLLIRKHKKLAKLHEEPAKLPEVNGWQVYLTEKGTAKDSSNRVDAFKKRLVEFKNLSASELEQYKAKATANKLENKAALNAWILNQSPEEIVQINLSRHFLNRLKAYKHRVPYLADPRAPKRPYHAYNLFVKSRWESGFRLNSQQETMTQISKEWKALSASEKQPFIDNAAVDLVRYEQEVKTVFGREMK